ncbi:hypothetical protein Sango_3083400 [Sesamum angolense]|uniref:Endonuclease/exonuclease/phosphatase domain-containing protein n=1 Tax=Sesamum angolense TaxID=2727404 RepID=A0AAE1VZ86_9LAMI|nr:hypothetical protein Sango_3083400 [Sesamum angolense]
MGSLKHGDLLVSMALLIRTIVSVPGNSYHGLMLSRRDWLVAGDFNEILSDSEKSGGRSRPLWQIHRFREALASTDLHDLGYEGRPFTWCNQHPEPDTIYERLDRACADPSWRTRFPNAVVRHIPVTSSDHDALLIDLVNTPRLPRRKRRPFRFEAMWASLAECEQVVRRGWNGDLNCSRPSLMDRQRSCAAQLQAWSTQNDHCSIQNKIQTLEKALMQIRRSPITAANKIEENRIRGELELLLAREENAEGRWLNEEAEIQEHIEAYFGEIFRSRNPSEHDLEKGTEAISVRISEDMLLELSKPYTAEEVSLALSQMAPLKSPGPDGPTHGPTLSTTTIGRPTYQPMSPDPTDPNHSPDLVFNLLILINPKSPIILHLQSCADFFPFFLHQRTFPLLHGPLGSSHRLVPMVSTVPLSFRLYISQPINPLECSVGRVVRTDDNSPFFLSLYLSGFSPVWFFTCVVLGSQ